MVNERIWGELQREGHPPINVKLDIRVREFTPDQSTTPEKRILQELSLSPMSGMVIEDGNDYVLRYSFEGKKMEEKKRVQNGKLYGK
jgi:hypothetical protein